MCGQCLKEANPEFEGMVDMPPCDRHLVEYYIPRFRGFVNEAPKGHVSPVLDEYRRILAKLEALVVRRGLPVAPPPPVDRTKVELTTGAPVPADGSHTELRPDGQQKGYVVLTAEERRKGFIRPVRYSYRHVGVRPKYPLRDLTPEEQERHAGRDYAKYEAYPESESPLAGRYWTKAQLESGCGRVTTMGQALAETYARDPSFYGGTFCCDCLKHLPLEEFVWEGTNERLGS